MKEWLDLFGLGALLLPAVVFGGGVYKLFVWAQVRLPPASEYAKSWLLGATNPIALGSVLLDLNSLLIGNHWRDRRRLWLVLTPTCVGLAWLMLIKSPTKGSRATVGGALDYIRSDFLELFYAVPLVVLVSLAIGLASFAVYDSIMRRLAVPVTNTGAILTYAGVLVASIIFAFIGYLVIALSIVGPISITPSLLTFHIPPCVDALKDWGCTVSGQITIYLIIISYCFFALAALPLLLLLILSTTFVLAVVVFPHVERFVAFIARKYFAITDQKLALEKPLEFLAPVAGIIAFAITSAILLLLRSIK